MTDRQPDRSFLIRTGGSDDFAAAFPISRETLDRLRLYADLLTQWQRTMNLVAPKTLRDLWLRHMADSAQVEPLAPSGGHWLDFGAGAGFPGLVVAILRAGQVAMVTPPVVAGQLPTVRNGVTRVTLVESDGRKCAFLAEVVRRTGLKSLIPVEILNARIETPATRAKLGPVDVVSARAVASLTELLGWSAPLFGPETVGLFPKGRGAAVEIESAAVHWRFEARSHPSRTEPKGAVVEIRRPRPRHGADDGG